MQYTCCARPSCKHHRRAGRPAFWLVLSQFSFNSFSRVSPVYTNASSAHYVHAWENFHEYHHCCCGCKVADCPNMFRSINQFFWHIYSLTTESKEEGTNKIAKCYKNLYVKKVVKQWLREAGPLIRLFRQPFLALSTTWSSISVTEFLRDFFPLS